MKSIEDMVDVNTIIGEPIESINNITIIPISRVCFGFAAGGSEFNKETVDEYSKKEETEEITYKLPFGGGSGAGVSISPVAFLVVQEGNVKLLPINHLSAIDKLLDYVPDLFDKVNGAIEKMMEKKKEKYNQDTKEENRYKNKEKRYSPKNTITYEFEYDNKKPETHIDHENIKEEYDD